MATNTSEHIDTIGFPVGKKKVFWYNGKRRQGIVDACPNGDKVRLEFPAGSIPPMAQFTIAKIERIDI